MARMARRAGADPAYVPGTDYVSLIQSLNRLPNDQVSAVTGEAGPRGTAAKAVMRARMGLDDRVSQAALAIPSSFPSSSVLRQIQGASIDGGLPALSEPAPDPRVPTNSLEMGPDRPTVAGAMPPPSRQEDAPPPPPQPITPQPISPDVGLAAAAPQTAPVAPPAPTAPPAAAPPTAANAAPAEDPEADERAKDRYMAMMQAGLGILASKNRSGLGAIGEGGLIGLQGYRESQQARKKDSRDEKLLARQEARDQQTMDMAIQKMALEKQLAGDRMALSREEMDITRSRYDPSNPLNAAQIERDKAAAAASYAAAWKAKHGGDDAGGDGVNFGKSAQGLAIARLVRDGVLTPEQGAMHLATKTLPGPNGEVSALLPGQGLNLQQARQPGLSGQEKEAILGSDKSVESATSVKSNLQQALDLNKDAYSGASAEARAWIDRNLLPGEQKRGTATTEYKNIIDNQAVANLKNVFPGSISNDERKAFSELQASVNKSPEEREAILQRAIAASESVAAKEAARANMMRQGSYFNPNSGPAAAPQTAPRASAAAPPAHVQSMSNDDLLRALGAK